MTTVTTKYGDMDEELLMKRTGGHDDENESVQFVEYYLRTTNELVHRSVAMQLKKPAVFAEAEVATF